MDCNDCDLRIGANRMLPNWLQLFYYPPKLSLATSALADVVAKEDLFKNEFFGKDATRDLLFDGSICLPAIFQEFLKHQHLLLDINLICKI
jgi:hypothetical protein